MVTNPVNAVRANVDKRVFFSVIAATVFVSGAAYLAVKSGIKPLAKAAAKIK